MCDWLGIDLQTDEYQRSMDCWIPTHNKIPAEGSALYARELFARRAARTQFHDQLCQAMLQASWATGGYIVHMDYFRDWERFWRSDPHPGCVLQAARRSRFAPNEHTIYKWCLLHYPSWIPNLWPHGVPHSPDIPQAVDLHCMD